MLVYLQYPYTPLVLIVVAMLFWRPVWALAFMAAIFPMDPWAPRLPVPGINTETIMIGVAFAVTVLRFGARLPPLRYSGPVLAFVAIMLIAFVVAIPWATSARASDGGSAVWFIFKYVKSMTFTALLFFIVYWWFQTPEDRHRMLVALCIALFLSSAAAILDFAIGINPRVTVDRASGFLANANATGESIGPVMFVPLYLLMRGRSVSPGLRGFAALTYAMAAVALVVTLSRGNWVAYFAAHGVFLLLVNRALLVAAVATAALVMTLGFPLLPEIVRERIEATTTTGGTVYRLPVAINLESSAASRVVFARIGLDMFQSSPVWGLGLNAYAFRTPEFGAKYGVLVQRDSHNLVTRLAAEAGLLGLAMLAWLVWTVFRCGRRLWRSDSPEYVLGAVLLAAGTHVFVSNLSSTAFLSFGQVSAQFWILYALSARAFVERFAEEEAPEAAPEPAGRWRRFAQRSPVGVAQA